MDCPAPYSFASFFSSSFFGSSFGFSISFSSARFPLKCTGWSSVYFLFHSDFGMVAVVQADDLAVVGGQIDAVGEIVFHGDGEIARVEPAQDFALARSRTRRWPLRSRA